MTDIDIFGIKPHPAADAFPMMEEELAQDIKDNGLQQPLVVDELNGNPTLIDGRNRREACRRAGAVPDYVLLDGQDPVAYILSANINRRHMTKGQRAVAVARIYPESQQGKHTSLKISEVSAGYVRQARFVLRHTPDLADSVLAGSISLDNAYEEARIRKGRADTHESRFNALKVAASDLADLVVEGQLNLEEAETAYEERLSQIRRENIGVAHGLHTLALHVYLLEHAARWEQVVRFALSQAALYQKENAAPLDKFLDALRVFAEHAGPLLTRILELKAEREDVEKG